MLEALDWLPRIAGALVLVGLAMGISRWQKVGMEKDMLVAMVRSFIQLIAIGYALDLIFNAQGPFWILLVVAVMERCRRAWYREVRQTGCRAGRCPRSC